VRPETFSGDAWEKSVIRNNYNTVERQLSLKQKEAIPGEGKNRNLREVVISPTTERRGNSRDEKAGKGSLTGKGGRKKERHQREKSGKKDRIRREPRKRSFEICWLELSTKGGEKKYQYELGRCSKMEPRTPDEKEGKSLAWVGERRILRRLPGEGGHYNRPRGG